MGWPSAVFLLKLRLGDSVTKEADIFMHNKPLVLVATCILLMVVGAACTAAAPTALAPSNQQPAAVAPAQSTAAPSNPQATNSLAPVCESTKSCQAPIAVTFELGCTKKIPYTNVLVPPGTTFEVADKSGNFTCADSGQVVNGQEVIACHGTQLKSFDLKLTNASCGGGTLAAGTGQCQDGFGYDTAQKCCAPLAGATGSATTVTVDLKACPLPQVPQP